MNLFVNMILVFVASTTSFPSGDGKRPGPNDVPRVVRNHPEGDKGPASGSRTGIVKTVGPKSITVEFNKPYIETCYDTDRTGRLIQLIDDIYPPLPPIELELTPDLRAGKCREEPGLGTYSPNQVLVGDSVMIDYSWSRAGVWTCKNISIVRRPGGKVPEAPVDVSAPFRGHKWHEYCQAHQDFEEKGTFIPLRFLSDYKERIAPQPRSLHAAPAPRVVEPRHIPKALP